MEIPKNPGVVRVIVRPGARETAISGFDLSKNCYRIELKARADKGKANAELIRFLEKMTKRKVAIITGRTSKEKLVRIL